MRVVRHTLVLTLILATVAVAAVPAQAGWGIGIGIGFPVYRPWVYHPYYYHPYPAVYIAPPPVYVQPAPVYAYSPVYQTAAPPLAAPATPAGEPATGPSITPAAATTVSQQNNGGLVQQLSHPDEQTRADAAMQLGRLKAMNAIDPLAATLSGDRSPVARDAAARALGLIGSPKALTALKYAAQADADRDVRHSAQFSIEVIQAGMKR